MGHDLGSLARDRWSGRSGEVVEFMIRLADAVPAWCADANPIDVTEALVADNDYSVRVALFGCTNYSRTGFCAQPLAFDDVPSFDGRAGRPQRLRRRRARQPPRLAKRSGKRDYSRVLPQHTSHARPESLGLAEENVEVLSQSGEVVIAFVHAYRVNRRPGSVS